MRKFLSAFLLAVCIASSLTLAAEETLPFRVTRVNERITLFTPGQYAPPATMTVITTPKGLIVIDTLLSPTLAELAMQRVKKELGRDDVLLVINTHDHMDHTGGNQVFKGVEIIGHESVVPAMKRSADGIAANQPRILARIRQRERQLQTLAADAPQALALAEANRIDRLLMEDQQKRFVSTPPTKTFADKLTVSAGGLELRLYYFGRAHTDNDIVIHIPKLGVLFTGDLFHTESISSTAAQRPLDIPRWLAVLDEVLKTGKGVRTVVGGHMLVYSREWLDAQHRYIRDLWTAVKQAKKEDVSLAALRAKLPLEPAFAYLAPYFDLKAQPNIDRHQANILDYWRVGLRPAGAEIERVMRQSGPDAARARFQELLAAGEREFFIDETEFNALGYRFLQQERKPAEACAVFEMNRDAFPGSWNTWDSLGEALLTQGKLDTSEACYLRSLELNPNSQSGKDTLNRIRLDFKNETKATMKFAPGRKTKLKGPYLGQMPPGLEPSVFAPGIVSTAGNFEFSIAFSPDGRELYFTRRQDPGGLNTMMVCRWEKDGWTAPEEAAFCKGFPSNEPHITPDGKKLYFGCNRQPPGADRAEYGIWVTERAASGWGEPRYHGPGMYVSSTQHGDLYMTDVTMAAGGGIIMYPLVNGIYQAPVKLPGAVNEPAWASHAFIAPDESYIIFDSDNRPGAQGGEGDLYVVFRNTDGSWSDASNLGDTINTPGTNFCSMVSPDGQYLLYSASRDIYWVSAEVIQRLRPGAAPQVSLSEEIKNTVLAGDLPRLQMLLAKDPALVKARDAQGRTLMHLAAAAGDLKMVRWLIGHGAEIDARTAQMSTPLMHAALSGKADIVRLLIAKGADVGARDSYQRTAFILVARDRGDADMARILLDAGADINAADRWNDTALNLAAWRGFGALIDLLLERGAELPADPRKKQQGFILAIANGLEKLFELVLAAGADLSVTDGLGGNLLHAAADGGSEPIMKALIWKKLDLNGKDRNGWTPLHRAAERGWLRAASLLVEHGARLNERTLAGETPYDLALAEKNAEVVDLLTAKGAEQGPPRFPELQGEYLGQKKPGAKPELFSPGIVSSRFGLHSTASFSPDGREVYWSLMIDPRTPGYSIDRLMVSRLQHGRWTYPQIAPFTGEGKDADVPFFTPDGKRLYFMSRRPLPGTDKPSDEHIWFMERQGDGWSDARPVDAAVNDLPHHWQFSVDRDYNLYFATTIAGGQGKNDIYCAKYVDGRYQEPKNLGAPVNTAGGEEMPFIAPDGSYLLFAREFDLFVSFRVKDGSWNVPVSLGPEINSQDMDLCPLVSADGNYLFFLSRRGGESHTWWVSAKVIEDLKAIETAPALSQMTSLEQIDDLAGAYFALGQIDKAVEAFEYAKSRFPAELYTIIRRLAFYHAQARQFDKVMDDWELGQSKGLFFPAESKLYEPLFQTERYRKFLAANKELLNTALSNAKAKYDVVLPESYDSKKKYPLFIVMHGNNINTAVIKPKWKLDKLAGRVILAFLQSSQVSGSESFIWDDLPAGRRDIAAFYAWLQNKYRIDRSNILIGGFSGGAAMAIDAALRQAVPARGFIALCPGGVLPGRADMEIFKKAARKNITGQIIAGEKDDPEEAKALTDLFAEGGLRIGLNIVPGLEHTFPADLPARLDSAVDLILK
ncbi:MAG: ankyrin repeat domain-containing protein [Candidatus Aminicenantes bacterium]|nr:ankyrin repeat domain-containing protein [Candidatus Aminicenantes bacterium]